MREALILIYLPFGLLSGLLIQLFPSYVKFWPFIKKYFLVESVCLDQLHLLMLLQVGLFSSEVFIESDFLKLLEHFTIMKMLTQNVSSGLWTRKKSRLYVLLLLSMAVLLIPYVRRVVRLLLRNVRNLWFNERKI